MSPNPVLIVDALRVESAAAAAAAVIKDEVAVAARALRTVKGNK
jgi:hypothetical protein